MSELSEHSSLLPFAPWYALKVRTRSETACTTALNSRGFTTFCPTYSRRQRYSDRWKSATQALFPGYVFCRFNVNRKRAIVSTYGVEYIVGAGAESATVPEREIEGIRRAIEIGAAPVDYLRVGQKVCVEGGPLAGVEGILTKTDRGDYLVVSISLLQRSVSVRIHRDQVSAV